MTKKIFIDFKQIKNDIKILANEIIHSKFNYQAIIAITGGGLVPARLLRNYLNIPIFCVNIKYYDKNDNILKNPVIVQWLSTSEINSLKKKNILIVDDLNDTGSTINLVVDLLCNTYTNKIKPVNFNHLGVAVLYDKLKNKNKLSESISYYKTKDIGDNWIVFSLGINYTIILLIALFKILFIGVSGSHLSHN